MAGQGNAVLAAGSAPLIDTQAIVRLRGRLPADFTVGVASSAFQIEGAATADGKGPSIWDEFCRLPRVIADGSDGGVACDHYNRLEADLDLIAALGVRAYRFSIAWPRIQPVGEGPANELGLAFYERLVDGLLARGIEPFATLYHWDLPAALQHQHGGWSSRETAYRFADYAALVAARLGDRIRSFATHNEPWVTATLGYETGVFAPGIRDRAIAVQASHNLLLSHGLAAQAIRAGRSRADVGIVLNMSPVYPVTQAATDVAAARLADGLLIRWYADALLRGEYPADILEHLGKDAPLAEANDAACIRAALDFLGINYYHPTYASADAGVGSAAPGAAVTDMGWEVAPRALTDLLGRLQRDYDLPPLFITENGAAYRDQPSAGEVADPGRRDYIETHLGAVADAVAGGVDVRGYFVWSLMENFEWAFGYSKRFGVYYVDYATQARILKASGQWFAAFARAVNPRRA